MISLGPVGFSLLPLLTVLLPHGVRIFPHSSKDSGQHLLPCISSSQERYNQLLSDQLGHMPSVTQSWWPRDGRS